MDSLKDPAHLQNLRKSNPLGGWRNNVFRFGTTSRSHKSSRGNKDDSHVQALKASEPCQSIDSLLHFLESIASKVSPEDVDFIIPLAKSGHRATITIGSIVCESGLTFSQINAVQCFAADCKEIQRCALVPVSLIPSHVWKAYDPLSGQTSALLAVGIGPRNLLSAYDAQHARVHQRALLTHT